MSQAAPTNGMAYMGYQPYSMQVRILARPPYSTIADDLNEFKRKRCIVLVLVEHDIGTSWTGPQHASSAAVHAWPTTHVPAGELIT